MCLSVFSNKLQKEYELSQLSVFEVLCTVLFVSLLAMSLHLILVEYVPSNDVDNTGQAWDDHNERNLIVELKLFH